MFSGVGRLARDVVPERLGFRVLHHEERVVDADVVEVVRPPVDGRDQTGPAVADRSKRRHPLLAALASLREVVMRHLVGQQGQGPRDRLGHQQSRVRGDLPLLSACQSINLPVVS